MATRRTTMRSSTGTKLYAVRDGDGKFKDIQTYKRAHGADLRHKSKAEKAAARGPIETAVVEAANDAVKKVKKTVLGAVTAVERVARRAVKQVANPPRKGKTTVTSAKTKSPRKRVAKKAATAGVARGANSTAKTKAKAKAAKSPRTVAKTAARKSPRKRVAKKS